MNAFSRVVGGRGARTGRREARRRGTGGVRLWVGLVLVFTLGLTARAQDGGEPAPSSPPRTQFDEIVETLAAGKPLFTLRLRTEVADAEGFQRSQAFTSRLALGYESPEYEGFKFLAELEDVRSADESLYNAAGLNNEPQRTIIADPESTELNRLQATYSTNAFGAMFRVGRQRITLDDQRFIGNVGWRQNEQTFDAALARFKPSEQLELRYYYVWQVNRIFGDGSSTAFPTQRRDFQSDSHLVHASFAGNEAVNLTLFGYFLDLTGRNVTGPSMSSSTYGGRATGQFDLRDTTQAGYEASYAYQVDGEHNPTHYRAHYIHAAGWLAEKGIGRVTAGYEHLGSYHSRAQFMTPLATAHKFNGWADSFLDNGGTSGLADFYVSVAPTLPFELVGEVAYHKYNTEEGGGDLGWEVDAAIKRKFGQHVTVLTKGAYFEGPRDPDLYRFWFEVTLGF